MTRAAASHTEASTIDEVEQRVPDDLVVKSFVAGRSVRDIAKRWRWPLAEINEIVSRWARTVLHPELREQQLAASLTRLDALERVFYRKAPRGDHRALAGCLQIMLDVLCCCVCSACMRRSVQFSK